MLHLVVSVGEISNPCLLCIVFLGSYPCDVLELMFILMTSSSSSKRIPDVQLVAFLSWINFLGISY
jgi:hypothetical protein